MPWITRTGDRVVLKPPWLETEFANAKENPVNLEPYTGYQGAVGRIRSFEFDMKDVHRNDGSMCLKFTRQIWRKDLNRWWVNTNDVCLAPARMANMPHKVDAYVALILQMNSGPEAWKAMWS